MSPRTSRRDQKRAEIIERLARHVLRHGLGDTGLRRLAEVAATSDRMLLYYFENKEEVLGEVFQRIGSDLAASIDAVLGHAPLAPGRALERVWRAIRQSRNADPLRLWIEVSGRAGRGDPFARTVVARMRRAWIQWLRGVLAVPENEKTDLAVLIMAAVDGVVVLYPTSPSQGDAAIAELVRRIDATERPRSRGRSGPATREG